MRIAGAMLAALLATTSCQPWYRDAARAGSAVLDEKRTTRELASARRQRDAGHPDKAAAILDETIHRNPRLGANVWLALVEAELAAGRTVDARAHARWALARLDSRDPSAARLRSLLVDSLARDGLVATALDLLESPTLDAALAHPALAVKLGELVTATKAGPETARLRLAAWLERYGEPDHPLLRAAREQIAKAWWRSSIESRRNLAIIRSELAAGHVEAALIAYADARPLLPDEIAAPLALEIERAASAAKITALTPDVHARATDGDSAVRRNALGAAIEHYRAVVLRAPWWTAARRNLEALLAASRS